MGWVNQVFFDYQIVIESFCYEVLKFVVCGEQFHILILRKGCVMAKVLGKVLGVLIVAFVGIIISMYTGDTGGGWKDIGKNRKPVVQEPSKPQISAAPIYMATPMFEELFKEKLRLDMQDPQTWKNGEVCGFVKAADMPKLSDTLAKINYQTGEWDPVKLIEPTDGRLCAGISFTGERIDHSQGPMILTIKNDGTSTANSRMMEHLGASSEEVERMRTENPPEYVTMYVDFYPEAWPDKKATFMYNFIYADWMKGKMQIRTSGRDSRADFIFQKEHTDTYDKTVSVYKNFIQGELDDK